MGAGGESHGKDDGISWFTVAIGVLFLVRTAARPLNAIRQFMSDNNAVVMMVVLRLLGAKFLGDGLAVI